jgi:D-alanine--D-alanine ligase
MEMKEIIGVVMGGPSAEREVSLNTGKAILEALQGLGFKAVGIDLDPTRFVDQLRENKVEIVFNAIHGLYGEDGKLQGLLDMLEIPYTGSGVLASSMGMDKCISKILFESENIPTPSYLRVRKTDDALSRSEAVLEKFEPPFVVKPSTQGSTIGLSIVQDVSELDSALEKAFQYDSEVLVEEFIEGSELTVAILGEQDNVIALPVIEIVPNSGVYDYHSKYTKGATEYFVPARISDEAAQATRDVAIASFKVLGCSGVARVDVRLDPAENPFVLEVNTVPGMTATSLVPKAAAAAGITFPELCRRILMATVKR